MFLPPIKEPSRLQVKDDRRAKSLSPRPAPADFTTSSLHQPVKLRFASPNKPSPSYSTTRWGSSKTDSSSPSTVTSTATSRGGSKHTDVRYRVKYDPKYGGKRLKLQGIELTDLPPELYSLHDLEVLILSPTREACIYYHLERFPTQITYSLLNLKVLVLDTNELHDVPRSIATLRHLRQLNLSNNKLRDLPSTLAHLDQLTSLHLAHNLFRLVPRPVCFLTSLEFLDLTGNVLEVLPLDVGLLARLRHLLLSFNRISDLPESLCNLTNLTSLWVGFNRIRFLPRRFGNLKKLQWEGENYVSSMIDGNPLLDPPLEVCRKGIRAITNHFSKQGFTPSPVDEDDVMSSEPTRTDSGMGSSLPVSGSVDRGLDDLARRRGISGQGSLKTRSKIPVFTLGQRHTAHSNRAGGTVRTRQNNRIR